MFSFIWVGAQVKETKLDSVAEKMIIIEGDSIFQQSSQSCECGASKWIEAYRERHGTAIIYVGRPRNSPNIEGLRLRPHRVRLVTGRPKKKKSPTEVQRTLFEL